MGAPCTREGGMSPCPAQRRVYKGHITGPKVSSMRPIGIRSCEHSTVPSLKARPFSASCVTKQDHHPTAEWLSSQKKGLAGLAGSIPTEQYTCNNTLHRTIASRGCRRTTKQLARREAREPGCSSLQMGSYKTVAVAKAREC